MSLHTLANHLQSAGRGEDKVLVHMTPGEVQGLQSLAMAHGGSLTINPETGLPEAGILSSLLPIVAGAFLGPAGLGLSAMQTGLAVGALGTAATGSLGKGLMMGFGAYGGAGLGEGLMSAGANAMPGVEISPIGADAASAADMSRIYGGQGPASWDATGFSGNEIQGAGQAAKDAAGNLGAVNQTGAFNAYQPQGLNLSQGPFANLQQQGVDISAANYPNAPTIQTTSTPVYEAPKGVFEGGAGSTSTANISPTGINTAPPTTSTLPAEGTMKVPSKMDQLSAGFKDVTSSGDKAWNFVKEHPAPFIGVGIGALQSYQEQKAEDAANAAKAATGPSYIRPYEMSVAQNQSAYAPNASTAEREYFTNPRFIPKPIQQVKEGGITSLAVGGPVEQMAAQNAVGQNTMYPQSQLQTPMYANPMVQRPMPNDVIGAGIDVPTDRYTGEQKMASGGTAAAASAPSSEVKYTYDPKTMQYTQTTTTTPAAAANTGLGLRGMGMGVMNAGGFGGLGSGINPFSPARVSLMPEIFQKALAQQQAQQPTVTTQTSGGIQTPYMQQAQPQTQPANPIVPNINIPQQQDVNQQLGLQAFYPFMEQQLAMKGSQLQSQNMADGGMAGGGYNLGGYSDGGRLLRGPGDGVSDSIPASIGNRQPARLADGEFVVPARIVSEIGNGSTEAGARKLYAMMDRVQKARGKTVGKNKVAVNTKAEKYMPA